MEHSKYFKILSPTNPFKKNFYSFIECSQLKISISRVLKCCKKKLGGCVEKCNIVLERGVMEYSKYVKILPPTTPFKKNCDSFIECSQLKISISHFLKCFKKKLGG